MWYFDILILLLAVVTAKADNSVQFKTNSNGQLSTSSTLRWVHAQNGHIPPDAVVGATQFRPNGQNNVYICRALHQAEWIPGQLSAENKTCVISLLGNVNSYRVYEVLQNVDNGSRLSWVPWDLYHLPPPGMIAGGSNFYIARKKTGGEDNEVSSQVDGGLRSLKGFSHYVGKFNPDNKFGRITVITEDDEVKDIPSGEILVETEPVSYELNNVKFNMARKKIRRERRTLAMTILRNTVDTKMEVDSVLEYNTSYKSYWGQGSAILTGLRTLIRNHTGKMLADIEWGIEENENSRQIFRVKTLLEPGTAVNVTLYGNETRSEFPYTGTLVSIYEDNVRKERKVNGVRTVHEMLDVKPIFSPVYFIFNHSLVPTTTTTTTTTTARTTDIGYTQLPTMYQNNINAIEASNQSNDMQSDDGAMSLESEKLGIKIEKAEEKGNVNSLSARNSFNFLNIFSMLLILKIFHKVT